jgi:predicted HicB family RNase H-like nuclease
MHKEGDLDMNITRRKVRPVVTTNLRLDRELHRSIKAEARQSERSFNAEVLWRLRQSLQQPEPVSAA